MEVRNVTANVDAIIAGLFELGPEIVKVAAQAALHEAEYELPLTRERVPIGPTGQLRLSGRVEGPDFTASTLTAGIAYGGPAGAGLNDMDVDYALPVHEDLEANHPIGQAKFVESVVSEQLASGAAVDRMYDEISAAMEGHSFGRFRSKGGTWLRGKTGFVGSSNPKGFVPGFKG